MDIRPPLELKKYNSDYGTIFSKLLMVFIDCWRKNENRQGIKAGDFEGFS